MKRKIKLIFMSALLLTNFISSKAQNSMNNSPLQVTEFTLDNGLKVILNEDHTKPEVFGVVVVKAGSKNDPVDATGCAHYQEHMLFKGTEQLGTTNWQAEKSHIDKIFELYDELGKAQTDAERADIQKQINDESLKAAEYAIPNELSNVINSMGGTNINAYTGLDQTVYYNSFPASQTERWLELYSHRFMCPVFRSFQAELEVVYEEKNMYNDMFVARLMEEYAKNLYKNHPYGQQTVLGSIEHLKTPSLNKMYQFFKTYYVANNMALVLSGDFNTEEIIPLIKEKFGRWQSGEIPAPKTFTEAPFSGREFLQVRYSPIKVGFLGFRAVPAGHPDENIIEVMAYMLNNESSTGLFDKLAIDNKINGAYIMPELNNDLGALSIIFIPKIIGQRLQTAEKIILAQIEKLKKGEFDESLLESVKFEIYRDYQTGFESIENKAVMIAEGFAANKSVDDLLKDAEIIKSITKEDIMRVANTYFGQNYFAFYSKLGKANKVTLEKPGFEPLTANTNAKSEFTLKLDSIQEGVLNERFVDFEKDFTKTNVTNGVELYHVNNPVNDIFSLSISYGVGEAEMPMLEYTSALMNYAGTENLDVNQFKTDLAKLGATISVSSNYSYFNIYIEGIDEKLPQVLQLVNSFLKNPIADKEKIRVIYDGERANRKMERSEADNVADALFEYVSYGEKSDYIDRLTLKQIKKLDPLTVLKEFEKVKTYQAQIHYAGTYSPEEITKLVKENITFTNSPLNSKSPVSLEKEVYTQNTIYFVDKKSLQSKIYFLINGENFTKENAATINAFNMYFGGGFSGIVLQEIREYRSMAYSAGAAVSIPSIAGKPADFYGFIGTQADKTIEAVTVFDSLVRQMPEKPERMDMITKYLIQTAMVKSPNFRGLTNAILTWQHKGYTEDPAKANIEKYKNLVFSDIVNYQAQTLKNKSMVIAIVGDAKKIDMKALEKFGKIIIIKEKDLFSK